MTHQHISSQEHNPREHKNLANITDTDRYSDQEQTSNCHTEFSIPVYLTSLTYTVLSFKCQRNSSKYITVKNYKDINLEVLRSDIQQAPWWVTSVSDDISDTISAWNDMYQTLIKEHIKTRKVKFRTNTLQWMNSTLRKMMNKRYTSNN